MQLPKTGDLLLGKYLLEGPLGEGGMGVVYAASHVLLGQRVAVKLIRPEYAVSRESVGRFLNEARAAACIESEHVARVLDVGMLDGGLPYMVLEYLDGVDLAGALETRGPLPIADVADHLLQAIEAIAHAHAAGIIHRDLKPSNIFLARRPDGTSRVKVLDFGISKITGTGDGAAANITRTNAILGSPAYMPPEQLRDAKSVDHRSDIWALGVVAYELLTGHMPFNADNAVALFAAIQEAEPTSVRQWRADVSAELDAIIMKCLRRLPEDRFASVTELGFALAPFGTGVATTACASSNRILPLSGSSSVSATKSSAKQRKTGGPRGRSVPSTLEGALTVDQRASGRTEAPVSSTLSGPAPSAWRARSRTRVLGTVGVAVGLVVALMVIGAAFGPRIWPRRLADPASASPGASMVATSTTSSASPAAPLPTPPAPSETPGPTASSPRAGPAAIKVPASPPAIAKPRTAPSASPSSASRPSCNPPYDLDEDGKKIWKRECL